MEIKESSGWTEVWTELFVLKIVRTFSNENYKLNFIKGGGGKG